jgi:hypothetical protein
MSFSIETDREEDGRSLKEFSRFHHDLMASGAKQAGLAPDDH